MRECVNNHNSDLIAPSVSAIHALYRRYPSCSQSYKDMKIYFPWCIAHFSGMCFANFITYIAWTNAVCMRSGYNRQSLYGAEQGPSIQDQRLLCTVPRKTWRPPQHSHSHWITYICMLFSKIRDDEGSRAWETRRQRVNIRPWTFQHRRWAKFV